MGILKTSSRTVSKKESEGYIRCNCTKGCGRNFCACGKMNMKCNSKCHDSGACKNKEEQIFSLLLCFMNKWFKKIIEFVEKFILLQRFITFIFNIYLFIIIQEETKMIFDGLCLNWPGKAGFAWNVRQSPMKTSFTWTLPDILGKVGFA